jgi:hypothetical protein
MNNLYDYCITDHGNHKERGIARNVRYRLPSRGIEDKISCLRASLAQSVEHLTLNQVVAGSSPAGGTVAFYLFRRIA